jgi:energy-coupling factor transport system ATP-binding protein
MIELIDVSYTYPGQAGPVLNNVSLRIEPGEFVLVVGASGAGKSTLLRTLNGLTPHFHGGTIAGTIRVGNRNPIQVGPRGMSDLVGFVFQDPEAQFVTAQVEDELAFAMENFNFPQTTMRRRIEEVLDQLSIAHLRRRRIDTLSGGERQRVAIGSVLTLQPTVLVLDEPTSQLDPQAAEEVLTTLQKLNHDLGLTIIISEHRLERVAQYADRVCYLPGPGQPPLLGPTRQILAQAELAPPLVKLSRKLGWQPAPLTIKEARRFLPGLSLNGHSQPVDPPPTAPPAIEVHQVWHRYHGQEHGGALQGVSLTVPAGQFVTLMGRNGSGKSTLLKSLVGLLTPQRGRITLLGRQITQADLPETTRRVGFVPQNPGRLLFNETVAAELTFTRRAHGLPPASTGPLLARLGLDHLAQAYPRDLSSGERQRVALAAILAAEPQVLLLDEPTRGLDYLHKERLTTILNELRAQGVTIVMATHDVELVARCTGRVVVLGDGQVVVDGPVRAVMTESLVFASQINKLFRDSRLLTVDDVLGQVANSE